MSILNFKEVLKKKHFENNTMKDSDLQRVYIFPIYPRAS